jgi:hypothetical protein
LPPLQRVSEWQAFSPHRAILLMTLHMFTTRRMPMFLRCSVLEGWSDVHRRLCAYGVSPIHGSWPIWIRFSSLAVPLILACAVLVPGSAFYWCMLLAHLQMAFT